MLKRSECYVIFVLTFCCLLPLTSRAQGYLTQLGDTSFSTTIPVELGYYDASTGNLHIEIPLGTWPQRGSHSFTASLVYDSRIWFIGTPGGTKTWQPTNVPVTNWGGWRLQTNPSIGGGVSYSTQVNSCTCYEPPCHNTPKYRKYSQFTWTDAYGTVRIFPINTEYDPYSCDGDVPTDTEYANDSSGYVMNVTNYTQISSIKAPDGTTFYPGFEDTNGNLFSVDSGGNVIDTLGRTPVKTTTNCNGISTQICYDVSNSQFNGSAGTSRYTVTTSSIYVNTAFHQSGVTEYAGYVTVVSSILLPDNTQYSFTYDFGSSGTYGELVGISLPTGGSVSYSYTTYSDMFANVNRWIYTRTSSGGQWTYLPQTLPSCPTGFALCQRVWVTKPSGDEINYQFGSSTGNIGSWATEITYYSSFPYPQVMDLLQTWSSGPTNVQILTQTKVMPVAGNQTVQYTYVSPYGPKISKMSEWKYYSGSLPSSPDRITTISGYCGTAPTGVTVTDGSGTQTISQMNITYDSYGSNGLTLVTGASNHDDTNFGQNYTSRCNPTSIQNLVSLPSNYIAKSMSYDTTGQLTSVTDAANNPTSLSYTDRFYSDNGSNPPATYSPTTSTNAYLTQITPPTNGPIKYGYYFGSGKQASSVDQNGADFYGHFQDSFDRLTATSGPLLNGTRPWSLYQYTGQTQVDSYLGILDTTPSSGCTSCRHDRVLQDSLGRVSQKILVSDPEGQATVTYSYDSNSRQASVSNPARSSPSPTDGVNTFGMDGLDRPVTLTHADNTVAHTYFGGAVTANGGIGTQFCSTATYGQGYPVLSIDEAGMKKETWTDGFGNMIEADEPDSGGNLSTGAATCYAYNLLDLNTQVAQGSETRSYTYDLLGRMTSISDPESGTTNLYYTTSGGALCSGDPSTVCRRMDARSITITYSYDSMNRLTSKTYSDTTPPVAYYYDQASYNGLTITNGKARRTGMSDGSGQTAWSFDAAGNTLSERRTIGSATNVFSYSYNQDGSLKSITYPSGRVISYAYSNAQRPLTAIDAASGINYVTGTCGPSSNGACYAPHGRFATAILGQVNGGFTGITDSYSYNNRLEPTAIKATISSGAIMSLVPGFSLPNGNNGTVASVGNADGRDTGRNQNYTYDPLNRIMSATSQATSGSACWGDNYSYDRYGNFLSATPTQCSSYSLSLSVDLHNHITNTGFGYDLAGNMSNDGSYSYTWDAQNRLSSAAGINYKYDGNSLRVSKSSGTLYWRSLGGQTLAESDSTGSTTNSQYFEYVLFNGVRISRRDSSGIVLYYFTDQVGNTRVIFRSDNNTVCFDSDYTPFGTELPASGVTVTCPQNYKFGGYERDTETSLDYATFRYYNSRLGRFMSPDPVAGSADTPQSLNRYSFVLNNPCSLVDPLGLSGCNLRIKINIKHKAVNADELKILQQRVQDIFAATKSDNGDTFNVTFTETGKADYSVNIDAIVSFAENGHVAYFGPFNGTPVVHAGSSRQGYSSANDAAVDMGTTMAHELTHRITHIGDIPYNGSPNLMNVDDATKQYEKGVKDDPNFRLPSGDLYNDNINANVTGFAKLTPKQIEALLKKCRSKGGGNGIAGRNWVETCFIGDEGVSCTIGLK